MNWSITEADEHKIINRVISPFTPALHYDFVCESTLLIH
jgi:hypothetical protein